MDITLVNIYVPNIEAPKYIKKFLEDSKKYIDNNTSTKGILTPDCEQWVDLPNKELTRILWH